MPLVHVSFVPAAPRPGLAAALLWAVVACGAVSPAAGAAAESGVGLLLRLDDRIGSEPSPSARGAGPLAAAATRARIGRTRERIRALSRASEIGRATLSERERLVAELRRTVRAQDRALDAMRASRRAVPARAAPAPVAGPAPAAAVVGPAPAQASAGGGPYGVYVDIGLGVVIVALLGWVLALRSRSTSQARELESVAASAPGGPLEPVPMPSAPPAPRSLGPAPVAAGAAGVAPDDDGSPARSPHPAEERTAVVAAGPRRSADQQALREVDTFIAYEDYAAAERVLDRLMRDNPGNPEYHLRLLHIQAAAGDEVRTAEAERVLGAMMDGPLSETINRVKEIGRGLMPGHALFDTPEQADEARRIIADGGSSGFRPDATVRVGPGERG